MTTQNKHLLKLAIEQAHSDIETVGCWTVEKDLEWLIKDNYKSLLDLKTALLKGRFYAGVESVSSSGMSRIIKLAYIKDNKLHGVSDFVYKMAGCDKNQRISGCGMDMLFHAQYCIFTTLCPKHKYQKSMKQYNNL